jgi:hypothetical protein
MAAAPSEICEDAVGAADWLERCELLDRCFAETLVARHDVSGARRVALLIDIGGLDGDVLAREAVFFPRLDGTLLRCEAERVGIFAGDAPLIGNALGAFEL